MVALTAEVRHESLVQRGVSLNGARVSNEE